MVGYLAYFTPVTLVSSFQGSSVEYVIACCCCNEIKVKNYVPLKFVILLCQILLLHKVFYWRNTKSLNNLNSNFYLCTIIIQSSVLTQHLFFQLFLLHLQSFLFIVIVPILFSCPVLIFKCNHAPHPCLLFFCLLFRVMWHPTGDSHTILGLCEDRVVCWDLNVASSSATVSIYIYCIHLCWKKSYKSCYKLRRGKLSGFSCVTPFS